MLKEYLSTLANAFRNKLGTTEKINAQSFSDKVAEVYSKGFADGSEQGGNTEEAYNDGFEAGKKAEYDAFWDTFQNYGEAVSYAYIFRNTRWTDKNFNPKYDLLSTTFYWAFRGTPITDTKKELLLTDDASSDALAQTFDNNKTLITIRKLRVHEGVKYSSTFLNTTALENIVFEGVIGQSLTLKHSSKLTHDSLMSVINHLKDFTGTDNTMTLALGETNLAKLTDEEKAIATQKGWTLA